MFVQVLFLFVLVAGLSATPPHPQQNGYLKKLHDYTGAYIQHKDQLLHDYIGKRVHFHHHHHHYHHYHDDEYDDKEGDQKLNHHGQNTHSGLYGRNRNRGLGHDSKGPIGIFGHQGHHEHHGHHQKHHGHHGHQGHLGHHTHHKQHQHGNHHHEDHHHGLHGYGDHHEHHGHHKDHHHEHDHKKHESYVDFQSHQYYGHQQPSVNSDHHHLHHGEPYAILPNAPILHSTPQTPVTHHVSTIAPQTSASPKQSPNPNLAAPVVTQQNLVVNHHHEIHHHSPHHTTISPSKNPQTTQAPQKLSAHDILSALAKQSSTKHHPTTTNAPATSPKATPIAVTTPTQKAPVEENSVAPNHGRHDHFVKQPIVDHSYSEIYSKIWS